MSELCGWWVVNSLVKLMGRKIEFGVENNLCYELFCFVLFCFVLSIYYTIKQEFSRIRKLK